MAYITLDDINSPQNLVTFTEVPNILKVSEPTVGTRATMNITFTSGAIVSVVTADTQYYITFLGESITNVMDPQNAKNKRFYIASNPRNTAASVCNALRNCPTISAQFIIMLDGDTVKLLSKTIGKVWSNVPNYFTTNYPSQYISVQATDGSTESGYVNGKIMVDIFNSNDAYSISDYVTTLEKNFYENSVSFDISAALSSFSKYGKMEPYTLKVSLYKEDGGYELLETLSASTMIGFQANQSDKYLYNNSTKILINNTRGTEGTKLYTYGSSIFATVMAPENLGGLSVYIKAYDSLGNELINDTRTLRINDRVADYRYDVSESRWKEINYIDLTIGTDTIRFYVIKPLKAVEDYYRVFWRNCYSGVQFFDFTGARSEQDSVEIGTYEKNNFDYYTNDEFEKKMIYSNDYSKRVTLTSHLMEKDGTYVFNDLMRSKKVWTEVNGKIYYIIPKSIEVTENDNYNDIYEVKFTYEYSDL